MCSLKFSRNLKKKRFAKIIYILWSIMSIFSLSHYFLSRFPPSLSLSFSRYPPIYFQSSSECRQSWFSTAPYIPFLSLFLYIFLYPFTKWSRRLFIVSTVSTHFDVSYVWNFRNIMCSQNFSCPFPANYQ